MAASRHDALFAALEFGSEPYQEKRLKHKSPTLSSGSDEGGSSCEVAFRSSPAWSTALPQTTMSRSASFVNTPFTQGSAQAATLMSVFSGALTPLLRCPSASEVACLSGGNSGGEATTCLATCRSSGSSRRKQGLPQRSRE